MLIDGIFNFIGWVFLGHLSGALVLYLNHRFVFHGRFGRLPLVRSMRKLHTHHHRHSFDDQVNTYLKTPAWGRVSLTLLFLAAGIIVSPGFAAGLVTFAFVYAYRHRITHNGDTSKFAIHHMHHHQKANVNFAGVYPIFDRIFFTYEEPK